MVVQGHTLCDMGDCAVLGQTRAPEAYASVLCNISLVPRYFLKKCNFQLVDFFFHSINYTD